MLTTINENDPTVDVTIFFVPFNFPVSVEVHFRYNVNWYSAANAIVMLNRVIDCIHSPFYNHNKPYKNIIIFSVFFLLFFVAFVDDNLSLWLHKHEQFFRVRNQLYLCVVFFILLVDANVA